MTRARDADLPELELLQLDDDEPAPGVTTVEVAPKRWWPIALAAAVVAGAIFVSGNDKAGNKTGEEAASSPTTTATAPTTRFVPVAPSTTRPDPAVVISGDATSLIVLAQGGTYEVDVTDPPQAIAGFVGRAPGTVVTLTEGRAVAWSRMHPEGLHLGPAQGVFASDDPGRVWLAGSVDGAVAVRELPIDGSPTLGARVVRVPTGFAVAGVAGTDLVLSGGEGGTTLLLWDPETQQPELVTANGVLVAAAHGSIAWTSPGCDGCSLFVQRGNTTRLLGDIAPFDPAVPGSFSPDGRFLALAIARDEGHGVEVVDLDGPRDDSPPVSIPEVVLSAPIGMSWSPGGALMLRDTSDRIVAYEPRAGGMARLFAFRPREQPAPSPLTAIPTRTPRTVTPASAPRTTLAPVPIPPG